MFLHIITSNSSSRSDCIILLINKMELLICILTNTVKINALFRSCLQCLCLITIKILFLFILTDSFNTYIIGVNYNAGKTTLPSLGGKWLVCTRIGSQHSLSSKSRHTTLPGTMSLFAAPTGVVVSRGTEQLN